MALTSHAALTVAGVPSGGTRVPKSRPFADSSANSEHETSPAPSSTSAHHRPGHSLARFKISSHTPTGPSRPAPHSGFLPSTAIPPLPGRWVIQADFDEEAYRQAVAGDNTAAALQQVDRATGNEARGALMGTGAAQLQDLYQGSQLPKSKAMIWPASHFKKHQAILDQTQGLNKADHISAGIFEDTQAAADPLKKIVDENLYYRANTRKRGKIEQFNQNREKARGLELKHDISLRSSTPPGFGEEEPRAYRAFDNSELDQVDSVLDRLPRDHVSGNPHLQYMRRLEKHPDDPHRGAEYHYSQLGVGHLEVYDQHPEVGYRATGETSELGQHDAQHGVTPFEEALTHEIGHSVEHHKGEAFGRFKELAGWQEFDSQEAAHGALTTDAMQGAQATQLLQGLDAERGQSHLEQHPQNHAGHQYMTHPDKQDRYFRRQLNRMPGDPGTPEAVGQEHTSYAKTSPSEHFAELYAQMVHVPERTYSDYVHGPEQRESEANDAVAAAFEERNAIQDKQSVGYQQAGARVEEAQRALTERTQQREALGGQWDLMRQDVFGVDEGMVGNATEEIREAAGVKQLGEVETARAVQEFTRKSRRAATPKQLELLKQKHLAGI